MTPYALHKSCSQRELCCKTEILMAEMSLIRFSISNMCQIFAI